MSDHKKLYSVQTKQTPMKFTVLAKIHIEIKKTNLTAYFDLPKYVWDK